MQTAAVIGRGFWRSAVAELSGDIDGGRATAYLTALVTRNLISPDISTIFDDVAFRFPAHPPAGRRLCLSPEDSASRGARAVLRLAGAPGGRPGRRVRRDHRLSP